MTYEAIIDRFMDETSSKAREYLACDRPFESAYFEPERLAEDIRDAGDLDGMQVDHEAFLAACAHWLDNTYDGGER